jgi:hypothetical protein
MIGMKMSSLMAVLLCALPLAGQTLKTGDLPTHATSIAAPSEAGPRRVVAPCTLVESSIGPSGEENEGEGRGFAIHILNNSAMTLDFPSNPVFGWRVETQHGKGWKLKAEGGPVRRVGSPTDPHLAVVGPTGTGNMVHISPTFARDYRFYLPEAGKALRHEGKLTTLKLSVLWAPSSAMKQADPEAPNCGLLSEWVVSIRP